MLLKLSLPSFLGMAVMTLYNVVDTVFIGHYIGQPGIGGLSIVFPIQMLMVGLGQMTGMGGASLISRSIGSNRIRRAEHTLGNSITPALILSLLVMVIGLADINFWLRLVGASETILPYAREYMIIILIGTVFQTLAMTMNMLVTAEGSARTAMTAMIIGALLNILLDAIFIIPLDMGIKGAALATVISQLVSVSYLLRYYLTGKSFLKIYFKNLRIDWRILGDILSIGIASLVRLMATSLSIIMINRALSAYGGDLAVSTFGILNRILMFAIMPGIVIGQGLQPILGFNYGALRFDRALKAIKIAMTVATICSLTTFLVLYFAPGPLIKIFTSDTGLITLGSYAAKRIFSAIYLIGFIMVGSTIFQAIGKPVQSFITALSRPVLFLLPTILILPPIFQLDGVWLVFPISDVLTFLLTMILLLPQLREIRRKGPSSKSPGELPVK